MPNMQDIDSVAADAIENSEGIANNGDDADLGALCDARCGFGCAANAFDNLDEPAFDRLGYRWACVG